MLGQPLEDDAEPGAGGETARRESVAEILGSEEVVCVAGFADDGDAGGELDVRLGGVVARERDEVRGLRG